MQYECLNVEDAVGFEWDDGNILKNEIKHDLSWQKIEEVFFNEPLIVLRDEKHSNGIECRCAALGCIDDGSLVTIIFTKRKHKIRVISARPMSKKERTFYENYTGI
jgi:uncharacterized DUF497 family protein